MQDKIEIRMPYTGSPINRHRKGTMDPLNHMKCAQQILKQGLLEYQYTKEIVASEDRDAIADKLNTAYIEVSNAIRLFELEIPFVVSDSNLCICGYDIGSNPGECGKCFDYKKAQHG